MRVSLLKRELRMLIIHPQERFNSSVDRLTILRSVVITRYNGQISRTKNKIDAVSPKYKLFGHKSVKASTGQTKSSSGIKSKFSHPLACPIPFENQEKLKEPQKCTFSIKTLMSKIFDLKPSFSDIYP